MEQQDLSDRTAKLGRRIGRPSISRYENNAHAPTRAVFRILVKALRCTPDDLLDDAPEVDAA